MTYDRTGYEKLVKILTSVEIDIGIVARGMAHLTAKEHENLFSDVQYTRCSAQGILYEMCVYEALIDLIEYDRNFNHVVANRGRIQHYKPLDQEHVELHCRNWNLNLGYHDIDLARFDTLLVDANGNLCIVEVKNGFINTKNLLRDYRIKQQLLTRITGQEIVPVIYIVSRDVSEKRPYQELMQKDMTFFALLPFIDLQEIDLERIPKLDASALPHRTKVLHPCDLPIKKLKYSETLSEARNRLFDSLSLPDEHGDERLLSGYEYLHKMTVGRIENKDLIGALESIGRTVEGEPPSIIERLGIDYTIVALDLSDLRPALYMKRKNEDRYIKVGPWSERNLRIDRDVTRRAGGFYRTMEITDETIDRVTVERLLKRYPLTYDNLKKKRWDRPALSSLLEPMQD